MSATPARVAVASRSIIAPRASRAPRGHARVRRARPVVVRRAGLEDTSDASVRSPAEEGEPTVTGPFPVDLSTLTADERAWLDARDELRVLVLGKTGVGKSSLVNAIANANSAIGRLDVGTTQVQRVENRITHGDESHDVCLFDTPGFFDVEGRTPAGVLRELGGKVDDYHAIVYAHVATDRRLRLEDEQSVSFIVRALGARCVSRVVIALTFATRSRSPATTTAPETKSSPRGARRRRDSSPTQPLASRVPRVPSRVPSRVPCGCRAGARTTTAAIGDGRATCGAR